MRRPFAITVASVALLWAIQLRGQTPTTCTTPRDACQFFGTFLSALNHRDWDAFRATLDSGITVMFDQPAPPERQDGRVAVEAIFRLIFPEAGSAPRPLPPPLVPENLKVQSFGDVVVVSFHLRGLDNLARRTLVLHHTTAGWRVVHIHGSSSRSSP